MTDPGPADLGVAEAAAALAAGRLTARALVSACLARIEGEGRGLNAFVHVAAGAALAEAGASDARRAAGRPLSALDGVPLAVKDNIDIAGQPTTDGLGTARTAERDAGVAALLRARGLVFLGKANMHEGALGATTDNPHHGRAENPAAPGRTPGGSSGGSAAALAARLVPGALGTDTMGSVRLPAAYCGIAGLKPSGGFWPNDGVVPLSTTLDTVGPMARSVEDLALLAGLPLRPARLDGAVFLRLDNFDEAGMEAAVRAAFEDAAARLAAAGATVRRVRLADYDPSPARRAGLLVSEVEGFAARRDLLAAEPGAFSPAFRAMLEYGARAGPERYAAARAAIQRTGAAFAAPLDGADALVSPTTPQAAFPFGAPVPATQADFTAPANFAFCPAVSIPLPRPAGEAPVGLQLAAARGRDARLLGIAASVETLLRPERE